MVAPALGESRRPPLCRTALTWCVLGIMALIFSLGTRFFRPTTRGLQVSDAIVSKSEEYRRQIRANEALEAELAYLKTERGTEWAVYKYIHKVKPGQQVGQVVEQTPPPPVPLSRCQRVNAWINNAQTASAAALRHAWEVLRCYVGLRPLDQPPEARNERPGGLSKPPKPAADKPASPPQ